MRIKIMKFFLLISTPFISKPIYAWTNQYSVKVSGGYGSYQDVYGGDAATGILRVAAADQFQFNSLWLFGAELGIQTGNRMRLTDATVAPLVYVTLPIFITITPPVDLLLTAEFKFRTPFYFVGKVGVSYFNMNCDSQTIKTRSFLENEVQLGAGYELGEKANVELSYQRIGGGRMVLNNVNVNDGAATLKAPPILQAMFLSVIMYVS